MSTPILDAKSALGIFPFDGTVVDTGDRTGATFETTGEFNGHLSFLGERVEIRRTGIDAEPFLAGLTDFLVEKDIRLFVVFKGIKRQLLGNFHSTLLIRIVRRKALGVKGETICALPSRAFTKFWSLTFFLIVTNL